MILDDISTHALTEGDPDIIILRIYFDISTHALTEGDEISQDLGKCFYHFNSRPHGGRLLPVYSSQC